MLSFKFIIFLLLHHVRNELIEMSFVMKAQHGHSHGDGDSCNGNHVAASPAETAEVTVVVPSETPHKSEKQAHKDRDFGKKDTEPSPKAPTEKKEKKPEGAAGEPGPKKEKAPKEKKEPTGPALELSPGTIPTLLYSDNIVSLLRRRRLL